MAFQFLQDLLLPDDVTLVGMVDAHFETQPSAKFGICHTSQKLPVPKSTGCLSDCAALLVKRAGLSGVLHLFLTGFSAMVRSTSGLPSGRKNKACVARNAGPLAICGIPTTSLPEKVKWSLEPQNHHLHLRGEGWMDPKP